MCLRQKELDGKIAKAPIKCYRFYVRMPGSEMIKSPHQGTEYAFREGMMIEANGEQQIEMIDGAWCFGGGFIHAFKELIDAQINAYSICGTLMRRKGDARSSIDEIIEDCHLIVPYVCVCEMEIPAGVEYFVGDEGDICAKKMILKREIKLEAKNAIEMFDFIYGCLEQLLKRMETITGNDSLITSMRQILISKKLEMDEIREKRGKNNNGGTACV